MKRVCMVVQDPLVKGGIAAVVNGYRGSQLESQYEIIYVESYKDGNKLSKLLKGIKGLIHFLKILIFDRPEIVHIHSSFGPSFYRKLPFIYLANLAKRKIINHIHGANFDHFYIKASEKKKRLIKTAYNKCDMLIALSEEWKQNLEKIVPSNKVTVIHNYSILHEDSIVNRYNRKFNNQVLFLGEIGFRKGCFDIPEILAKVVTKVPNVKFYLGGSGDIEQVYKKCIELGVENNVFFLGWIRGEEKDKLLRESDLFLLPSYNEGMPMSILDAMGYGLPIVSTNVGGIPNIVHHGKNGYICEPGDIDKLSEGIIGIMDKDKSLKYGETSIEMIKEKYSLDSHLLSLTNLYDTLCNEKIKLKG